MIAIQYFVSKTVNERKIKNVKSKKGNYSNSFLLTEEGD